MSREVLFEFGLIMGAKNRYFVAFIEVPIFSGKKRKYQITNCKEFPIFNLPTRNVPGIDSISKESKFDYLVLYAACVLLFRSSFPPEVAERKIYL